VLSALSAPRLRLGTYLLALVALALLPAMLAGGLTAAHLATAYRTQFEDGLRNAAGRLAAGMDKELELNRAVLQLMGQARGGAGPSDQLLDAAAELLGAAPRLVAPQAQGTEAAGRELQLAVPLTPEPGSAPRWLGMSLNPSRLARELHPLTVGPGGFVMVLDADGHIAARLHEEARFVGRPAPEWLRQAVIDRQPQGLLRGTSLEGTEVLLAFSRLHGAPWTVAVAEPLRAYQAAWRAPLLRLGATGLVLALVAGGLALLLARSITGPMGRLMRHAETIASVGPDRPLAPPPPTSVAEVETLRRALLEAEDSLRRAARRERDQARHQRLLAGELSHRVKNALAVVQAVAAATFRSTRSLDEFRGVFDGRLQALARAHGLLLRNEWQAASLTELLSEELAPFRFRGEGSIVLEGPRLRLPPRHGLSLGLIVHELATNAAKHGAFAPGKEGRLRVRWWVEGGEAGPAASDAASGQARLNLVWEETGIGPVSLPGKGSIGMGQRLIRRIIGYDLGGTAEVEQLETGLRWHLRMPLPAAGLAEDDALAATDQAA
jgi:two-component sensor histidine kinase